ncbi:MAG TPA: SOS response-associated peptidase, partial [Actinomycetaceae bacterium]|nr:SOS response-associated peptidase [Actinomycetaceae bacterium]
SFRQAQDLADAFAINDVTTAAAAVHPSFNVAPTQQVRIGLERDEDAGGQREMHAARWGLVPPWSEDLSVGSRLINARSETAAQKRSFAPSVRQRRCFVPADGYYEWQRGSGRSSTPYFIHRRDAQPMALAGLYAFWRDPSKADDDPDRWVLTMTILTRASRGDLAALHHREPVVVGDQLEAWLDPALTDAEEALALLDDDGPPLAHHRVGPEVGNVNNDHEGLITPVAS